LYDSFYEIIFYEHFNKENFASLHRDYESAQRRGPTGAGLPHRWRRSRLSPATTAATLRHGRAPCRKSHRTQKSLVPISEALDNPLTPPPGRAWAVNTWGPGGQLGGQTTAAERKKQGIQGFTSPTLEFRTADLQTMIPMPCHLWRNMHPAIITFWVDRSVPCGHVRPHPNRRGAGDACGDGCVPLHRGLS